jgi:hypothetical protein
MRRFVPTLPSRRRPAGRPRSSEEQWEWWGDANASVFVAGHSHRWSYRAAFGDGLASGVAVLLPKGPVDSSARARPDRTYWRTACGAPGRVLALVWGGNQQNMHFMFEFDEPLRLHDSGEPGTVVPASMISAFWERSLAGMEANVTSVRAEHLVLLGTPPPKTDKEIRAGLAREPRLLELVAAAGESVDTVRITPTAVRVGLWKILQADLEAQAARIGAVFVPVPASAQTADGCLKPEYSVGDASHANGAFGALMLGEIEAALAQAEVART